MAAKKAGRGGWFLFWLAFFMGVTLLFMLNLEHIKGILQKTGVAERLFPGAGAAGDAEEELDRRIHDLAEGLTEGITGETAQGGGSSGAGNPAADDASARNAAAGTVGSNSGDNAAGGAVSGSTVVQPGSRSGGGTAGTTTAPSSGSAAQTVAEKTRVERTVYLMKVDNTGAILWAKVKRNLPASDQPLQDALESLVKGPSAAEEKQGLISFIPGNVKILGAAVRGTTAYISLSEDFLFNTYGVEGYAGQRRQIVLTATEFSTVKDVQILIDGKRIDYLGEGIWIGSPLSRSML